MNENIDLTKILKNCPKGWEFYSPFMGDVKFYEVDQKVNTVVVILKSGGLCDFNEDGTIELEGITSDEIMLYPSRDQRDWSKFTAPWYKKGKFDPNTLKTFDRVLTRHFDDERWEINFYSYTNPNWLWPYTCMDKSYKYCIPYNDDTKHLIGTTDEAPEFYKHWED